MSVYRTLEYVVHLVILIQQLAIAPFSKCLDTYLSHCKLIGYPDHQAGFRPGRSCAGQLLNLTQHIEDDYERKMLTCAASVDLSAAYGTVQLRLMIRKLVAMSGDIDPYQVIRGLLSNPRFFVQLNDKKSRWRIQKNGLSQGSVLAPLLFNSYANDQHMPTDCSRFIYADDICNTPNRVISTCWTDTRVGS